MFKSYVPQADVDKGFTTTRQGTNSTINSLLTNFNDTRSLPQANSEYVGLSTESETSNQNADQGLQSQTNTNDLHGMAKFLATINSEDPLVRGLAKGIDLSTLGLSLNSAEYDRRPSPKTSLC